MSRKTYFAIIYLVLLAFVVYNGDCARIQTFHKTLNVTVLYESLCPDSVRFITNQLKPAWESLNRYTLFTYVPFGHAYSINSGKEFRCQHGPEECAGNMMQSCSLYLLKESPRKQMKFLACQMNGRSSVRGTRCIRRVGLKVGDVRRCQYSGTGTFLQLLAERTTKSVNAAFIPTILFNGKFDQSLQKRSLSDFKGAACSFLKHTDACKAYRNKFG